MINPILIECSTASPTVNWGCWACIAPVNPTVAGSLARMVNRDELRLELLRGCHFRLRLPHCISISTILLPLGHISSELLARFNKFLHSSM